jgi:hypothetical protein
MHQITKIYFVIKFCMFRASSLPIIRSYLLYTRQLVRFMQVMWPLPSTVRFQPDSVRKRSHNLHETYQLPSVQQITPDDGHRRCPKHVEFYDKINFRYWMHLFVCFIRKLSRCTVTWKQNLEIILYLSDWQTVWKYSSTESSLVFFRTSS